jgi:hemolysin-activating ACP:hemolysin acyltransferase
MIVKKAGRKPAKTSTASRANKKSKAPRKTLAKRKTAAVKPSPVASKSLGQIAARRDQWWKTFSQTIAVLMRDAALKNMKIGSLESLVLPPIIAGQCRVAHIKTRPPLNNPNGGTSIAPVAVALWARVSPAIDKILLDNLDRQVPLGPADWASGDNIWLTLVAGDKKYVAELLKNLAQTEFKGHSVKVRSRGPDGKTIVKLLGKAS